MEVKETRSYDLFRALQGNRAINQINKEKIKSSMKQKYLVNPIMVNENYEVIDGQHRLQAAKELLIPIHYYMVSGYGIDDVQKLNVNQKNWSVDDYVDGFIQMGKTNYSVYKMFRKTYNLPAVQSIEILEGSVSVGAAKNKVNTKNHVHQFKAGNLKIKNLKESERIAKAVVDIGNFYDGNKRKAFVATMMRLMANPNFDINVFLEKLSKYSSMMIDCTNGVSYLALIEDIYNYRNRNKVNLRF